MPPAACPTADGTGCVGGEPTRVAFASTPRPRTQPRHPTARLLLCDDATGTCVAPCVAPPCVASCVSSSVAPCLASCGRHGRFLADKVHVHACTCMLLGDAPLLQPSPSLLPRPHPRPGPCSHPRPLPRPLPRSSPRILPRPLSRPPPLTRLTPRLSSAPADHTTRHSACLTRAPSRISTRQSR